MVAITELHVAATVIQLATESELVWWENIMWLPQLVVGKTKATVYFPYIPV